MRCALFSPANVGIKVILMDGVDGGGVFLFMARSQEIAQSILAMKPYCIEELFDFLAYLDRLQEEGALALVWEVNSWDERKWMDGVACEITMDVRALGESIVQILAGRVCVEEIR